MVWVSQGWSYSSNTVTPTTLWGFRVVVQKTASDVMMGLHLIRTSVKLKHPRNTITKFPFLTIRLGLD